MATRLPPEDLRTYYVLPNFGGPRVVKDVYLVEDSALGGHSVVFRDRDHKTAAVYPLSIVAEITSDAVEIPDRWDEPLVTQAAGRVRAGRDFSRELSPDDVRQLPEAAAAAMAAIQDAARILDLAQFGNPR